ncbi:hypothetical protein D3C84_917850 [compost metagenome]
MNASAIKPSAAHVSTVHTYKDKTLTLWISNSSSAIQAGMLSMKNTKLCGSYPVELNKHRTSPMRAAAIVTVKRITLPSPFIRQFGLYR